MMIDRCLRLLVSIVQSVVYHPVLGQLARPMQYFNRSNAGVSIGGERVHGSSPFIMATTGTRDWTTSAYQRIISMAVLGIGTALQMTMTS